MSWPVGYRRLAKTLADVSGSEVYVAPITPFDWALGRLRGYGQLVFEVASTVDRALLESDSEKAVLVGYSAGGILARVYVGGDPPYGGRRYSGHRRVSHLITLGTPHNVPNRGVLASIAEVNELFPGALHPHPLHPLSGRRRRRRRRRGLLRQDPQPLRALRRRRAGQGRREGSRTVCPAPWSRVPRPRRRLPRPSLRRSREPLVRLRPGDGRTLVARRASREGTPCGKTPRVVAY